MDAHELNLAEASAAIAQGDLSPVELLVSVLARIEAVEPAVGAFAQVSAALATEMAKRAADEILAGHHRGPLHGIPVGYKDLIDVAGLPTTASSRVPPAQTPQHDAQVVARLRAAGTVTVGKTHTHEFAAGVTTPTTRNPWALDRVPGGSSGGSAAAVAARECVFTLGTDTGGSIRIPASFCGVVGLKPTYELLPREGVIPLSWSLDHVGPITRTVGDAAVVLSAMTGENYQPHLDSGVDGLRLGVLDDGPVDHQVHAAVAGATRQLVDQGASPRPFTVPELRSTAAVSWTLTFTEAASFHQSNLLTHTEKYGADVRTMLEIGHRLPATRYVTAQRARGLLKHLWREAFAEIDVVIGPTVPCEPLLVGHDAVTWPEGTVEAAPDAYSRFTLAANVIGLPAITLPVGLTAAGLPIGVQLIGRPYAERRLLEVAAALEAVVRFDAVAGLKAS